MTGRYIAASILIGVALGALVYRYGMLPLGWSSPMRHVFTGGAIGLAVGAHALIRDGKAREPDAKRPAVPPLLALGALGVLVAFGVSYLAFPGLARASIEQREFPGFSLALPKGEVIEDSFVYANGKYTAKNVADAGGVVIVQWQLGTPMTPEELKLVANLMGPALGKKIDGTARTTTVPGSDGKPVDTILYGGGGGSFTLSMLTCGNRQVLVATGGGSSTLELQKRVIASFQCKPDPKQEATAAVEIPLVLDLPGWYMAVREIDQIQITDGVTGNLTMRTFPRDFKVDLADVLGPIFKAAGIDVKVGEKVGERVPLTLSEGSDSIDGWATLKPCPTGTAMVLGLADTPEQLDQLYERVRTARCLRPGEPAQQWPDPPPGAPTP